MATLKTCPKCGYGPKLHLGGHVQWCGKTGVDEAAFWGSMERIPFSGCWIWTKATYHCDYGAVHWRFEPTGTAKRKLIGAHRAAWMLVHGPIPEGMDVCHTCDVRLCCNPYHLFLGTAKDNMADCKAKGRNTAGERSGKAKITEAQALEILKAKPAKIRGSWHIAEALGASNGITPGAVACIWRGDSWAYLQEPA